MDEFDQIEEKLKAKKSEEEKTRHKVSGRSVFQLKKIIQNKAEDEKSQTENIEEDRES